MMQIHFVVHILSIGVNVLYSYLFFSDIFGVARDS